MAGVDSAATRRRQRRLRQFLRHERLSVAVALAEMQHHTAPHGQMTARAGEDHELNYTATVRTHPPQAASTVYYTFGDDEEVLAAGVCRAPLSEVAGPQERVQGHIVEQIEEFVPMVQILDIHVPREGASFPAGAGDRSSPFQKFSSWGGSLESMLRWWPCRRWPSRRPDFVTPRTLLWSLRKRRRTKRWRRRKSWRCSTSPSTGSSTPASAPGACAAITWRVAAKRGGAARSRRANKSFTLLHFVEQNVDAPVPQITVELTKEIAEQSVDVPMPQTLEFRGSCADHTTRRDAGGIC